MKDKIRNLGWRLMLAVGIIAAFPLVAFAEEGAEYEPNLYGTFWSLVPAIVAIILALISKEVYSSLFAGLVLSAVFYAIGSDNVFATALENLLGTAGGDEATGFTATITDSWNMQILAFTTLLGCFLCLMNKSGGSAAFGRWALVHIKSRVGAQIATIILGMLIFVDDYFNCLTVGAVMRPVTDKHNVSRAKLAYLIDSTAAPICIIAPISSWAAAVTSYLEDDPNGFLTFVKAIPYNFYALLTLLMLFLIVITKLDYGPMKLHEYNARVNGDLFTTADRPYGEAEQDDPDDDGKARVIDLVIPVIILIVSCVIGLLYAGSWWVFGGESFKDAFADTNAAVGLFTGVFIAYLLTFIYMLVRGRLTFKDACGTFADGFKIMGPAMLILIFAWTLGSMTKGNLGSDVFVIGVVESAADSLQTFLPAIIFIFAGFIAFSTGTSWGTFGIMMPIVYPVMSALNNESMLLTGLAACMAGGVVGDHCSPISDTTILSSAGAQSNHVNHVQTQLPYALTCAGVCFVAYIIQGLIRNIWISLPIAIVLLFATIFVLKQLFGKDPKMAANAMNDAV